MVAKADWQNHQFSFVAPALVTPATITAGQMNGAVIRSAYDADIVSYQGQYLASFECSIVNKQEFRIQGISTCVGVFDPATGKIDLNRTNVVVSTQNVNTDAGLVAYTASVPHLLVLGGRLYLYWDAAGVQRGKIISIAVRGAELNRDTAGFYWAGGARGLIYSLSPQGREVWGADPSDPQSDSTVDLRAVWSHDGMIVAMASVGGSGCTDPRGQQPGCYRVRFATATRPIGTHVFSPVPENAANPNPSNPMGYARLVRDPEGNWVLLGVFFRPVANGTSESRPALDWTNVPGVAAITVRPFTLPDLAPTPAQ